MNDSPQASNKIELSEKQHQELAKSTLQSFRIVFSSVKKHFRWIESQCGISGSQLWALWELHTTSGLMVSELAQKLSIHQSTASNLLDKLEKKELISRERNAEDQRVVRLYLTSLGQDVIRRAPNPPQGVLPDALEHLPASTLYQLHESLKSLLAQMKIKDDSDAMKHLSDIS